MKKLMMAVVVAAGAASALAMPTKDELTKAQPLVAELMAPAMAKYKAAGYKEKATAAAKVGDASSEFAKAAETEAAKFLLLKGAVSFYTRGEAYDKAADMIAELQREVKDVPPAVIAEITGKATGKISEAKAPKLYAIYRSAKLQVRAADEAKALAAKLKKAKSDALQRKYAEALAVSGDWKAAYVEFAKVSDAKLKEIAAAESAGNAKNAESGEFWWAYQPAFEDAEDFFKSHAAAYYRKALDAGEITGLKKNIVEQRIKGYRLFLSTSSGGAAATSATAAAPSSGKAWQEKGNTAWLTLPNGEKLEFAKCPAGSVDMPVGCANCRDYPKTRRVKISRPFWIMTKPLTRKDFKGYSAYSALEGDMDDSPTNYPQGSYETVMSYAKALTDDFRDSLPKGCLIRLPSIAEWGYAYRAGSRQPDDPYANFDVSRRKENAARCKECFWGGCRGVWNVSDGNMKGKTRKNNWGLHEFWREKVLDKVDADNAIPTSEGWRGNASTGGGLIEALKKGSAEDVDPLYWSESTTAYPVAHQLGDELLTAGNYYTIARLVIGPDLVSEWKAKHGKK